jgi:hypothetical protein
LYNTTTINIIIIYIQVAQYFLADEGAVPEELREPIVEHLVLAHQVTHYSLLLTMLQLLTARIQTHAALLLQKEIA